MWTLECVDAWLCSVSVYAHLTLPPPLAHGHLSVQLPQVFFFFFPQVFFKSCVENCYFVPAYSVPFLGSGFLESGGMNDLSYVGCCFASQRTSKVLRVQFHQPLTSLPSWWTKLTSNEESYLFFFLAVPDLHCCAGFSLVGVSGSYSLVVVHSFLIAVASLVVSNEDF